MCQRSELPSQAPGIWSKFGCSYLIPGGKKRVVRGKWVLRWLDSTKEVNMAAISI